MYVTCGNESVATEIGKLVLPEAQLAVDINAADELLVSGDTGNVRDGEIIIVLP